MKTVSHIQRNPNGHWVGDGFPVRSIFSYQDSPAAFSPFCCSTTPGPPFLSPPPSAAAWASIPIGVSRP